MVWLLTLGCLAAYIVGLVLLVKIMPGMLKRAYDDALFIGVAAVAILGAMLSFGSIGVTYSIFNGSTLVRIFDGLLLLILLIVAISTAMGAFRPRFGISAGTYRASRILTGSFFLALAVGAVYVLVLLFKPA